MMRMTWSAGYERMYVGVGGGWVDNLVLVMLGDLGIQTKAIKVASIESSKVYVRSVRREVLRAELSSEMLRSARA